MKKFLFQIGCIAVCVPISVSAHDAVHQDLVKGGLKGDALNWSDALQSQSGAGDVVEISTGQILLIENFSVPGELTIVTPYGDVFPQDTVYDSLGNERPAVAYIGRDCRDFSLTYTLVLTPNDTSKSAQELKVMKHPLNSDGTLAEPWPAGTECPEED